MNIQGYHRQLRRITTEHIASSSSEGLKRPKQHDQGCLRRSSPHLVYTIDYHSAPSSTVTTVGMSPPPPLPEKLDPELVHRVLLTDPSDYAELTMAPARLVETPSFADFSQTLHVRQTATDHDQEVRAVDAATLVAHALKGAYRDQMVERMIGESTLEPIKNLLIELHASIRQLIPSRADLHQRLSDHEVRDAASLQVVAQQVLEAGQALEQLESEARVVSTQEWRQQARARLSQGQTSLEMESASFFVTSILYLLFKTELCQSDKADFFVAHVWAQQIATKGVELERQAFEETFGGLSVEHARTTRAWLEGLVEQVDRNQRSTLQHSIKARKELVLQGWVNEIIFRNEGTFSLPEILWLDTSHLAGIRQITKTAAAGSALALFASQAAGQPALVLAQADDLSSPLGLQRIALVQAILEQWKEQEIYEQDVARAVVALAQHWDPTLNATKVVYLQNSTQKVLRGQDPVIGLLDGRMREGFAELLTKHFDGVVASGAPPASMQTGRSTTPRTNRPVDAFGVHAAAVFGKRGLSFYASDLAMSAKLALKIINLVWHVYADPIIEPALLAACRKQE